MNSNELWNAYKKLLDPYEQRKEDVSLTDLFNFFDTDILEEFFEFLEGENE